MLLFCTDLCSWREKESVTGQSFFLRFIHSVLLHSPVITPPPSVLKVPTAAASAGAAVNTTKCRRSHVTSSSLGKFIADTHQGEERASRMNKNHKEVFINSDLIKERITTLTKSCTFIKRNCPKR